MYTLAIPWSPNDDSASFDIAPPTFLKDSNTNAAVFLCERPDTPAPI